MMRALPNVRNVGGAQGDGTAVVSLRGLGARQPIFVDGRRLVNVSGGIGHNGDPTNNGSDGTEFVDFRLSSGFLFGSGATKGVMVLGAGTARYGDDVENADDDQTTFDLNVGLSLSREFSASVALHSIIRAHYGDSGTFGTGYLRPGLQYDEVFDWQTRTTLDYRFDGLSLDDKGWGFSTYYRTQAFYESGSDEVDSLSITIGQEVRNTLNDQTTIYVGGEYGMREWDRWSPVDSDVLSFFAGVRTEGSSWNVDALAGWEQHEYDDKSEEFSNFRAELHYNHRLSDALDLTVKAKYGVQELFVNEGGSDFADPRGVFFGARLEYSINDKAALAFNANILDVESEFSSADVHRGELGIDGRFRIRDSLTINPSILWVNNDDTPSGDDDYIIAALRVVRSF